MSTTSGPALCAGKRNKATQTAGTAGKSREPQDWTPGGRRCSEHTRVLPALDVAGGARMEGLQGQETGVQGWGQTCFLWDKCMVSVETAVCHSVPHPPPA